MRRALWLARKGLETTTPNPRVGCVIVSADGRLVGEGWHERAGEPHAEVHALRQAGEAARGATCYVTLEPCSHHGRTPPCADALITAGLGRVVVALQDPNPRVAGQGIERLRRAGIPVDVGQCAAESAELNRGFLLRMTQGRPWFRLKSAATLDGRTALADGRSRWITGDAARRDVHRWRARSCLVLTTIATVLADDPELTVRHVPCRRQPRRAVLDSTLRLPESARLLQGEPVWIFTVGEDREKRARLEARGHRVIQLPANAAGRIDLAALAHWLGKHEINEVLIEAGATANAAFLSAGLVDEWLHYAAPCILGDQARALFALPEPPTLEDAPRFRLQETKRLGEDLRLRLRPADRA
ncbi:MAG: bifunctional diaminohydroxyphosphoribosylaminopyrimidine deaminase/5-amino-6-(5-phosphoribosylamino)uracil reductase RibD [Rhodocyclales bacterium]|nr:bifunctional diaminohydroxyphosphoribosylaminopyrimidine deaminase/5-amino-6-(5-phosphoribosylamino)uracil reductase RibD [Rhodocyclales bacterium]